MQLSQLLLQSLFLKHFLQQLKDGGRLLIPVGDDEQQLLKTRHGDEFLSSVIEMVRFCTSENGWASQTKDRW